VTCALFCVLDLGSSASAQTPAEPGGRALHGDKRVYDLSATLSAGTMGAYETATVRLGVDLRVSDHVAFNAVIGSSPRDSYSAPDYAYHRYEAAAWRTGAGVALTPLGTGLHGLRAGMRVVAGPAHFRKYPYPQTVDLGDPTHDNARVEVQPFLGATWVGHPGFTFGVEAGFSQDVCCSRLEGETRLRSYLSGSVGWSFARQAVPALGHALDDVPERRRSVRRFENRLLGYTLGGAAAVAAALLPAVLFPPDL
jgi:hypothetical protein